MSGLGDTMLSLGSREARRAESRMMDALPGWRARRSKSVRVNRWFAGIVLAATREYVDSPVFVLSP